MITIPFFKNPLPFFKKSSTKVSDTYIKDAAIQYYTITNSGIDLKDISIVHINNQYVKNGPIDVHELFAIVSVKDRVLEMLPGIPNQVSLLKSVLKQPEAPEREIGPHCSNPYPCDFAGHCWKDFPTYSVFNIANLRANKKFDLLNDENSGCVSIVPNNLKKFDHPNSNRHGPEQCRSRNQFYQS